MCAIACVCLCQPVTACARVFVFVVSLFWLYLGPLMWQVAVVGLVGLVVIACCRYVTAQVGHVHTACICWNHVACDMCVVASVPAAVVLYRIYTAHAHTH